jgi:hypothetical protein
VTVALYYFCGTLGGLLGTLGKTVKSHHNRFLPGLSCIGKIIIS